MNKTQQNAAALLIRWISARNQHGSRIREWGSDIHARNKAARKARRAESAYWNYIARHRHSPDMIEWQHIRDSIENEEITNEKDRENG